ncbi:MAG: hypothetical protein J7623_16430 [Chitinophaga sp.]|uniref:hypothetical protein n=1 Tax=Chitinophaga sp. TaxID=1869181 RepID=UPI001B19957F|nr:hypothetical protein [Chitinophaga sp.]MBO9730228.1 hypothetical protein [Chitinophaga sp.]
MRTHSIVTMLLLVVSSGYPFQTNHAATGPGNITKLQQTALSVLTQKCNVCHRTNNPGKVFTADNMESLAPKIYKQVFVKRRMPKGRDIKLTVEEEQQLRDWLDTVARHE